MRLFPLALALSLLLPGVSRGVPLDPFYYQWRDIIGRCMDTCNNNYYRCPCIRVVMPR